MKQQSTDNIKALWDVEPDNLPVIDGQVETTDFDHSRVRRDADRPEAR